ncbi:uncharacterized protein VTP21DRAFT_8485 [Calcarisporiella thermophila]|uniref:uncharacterized protein n=1 Tax=Calcarisporiella thermophila TaxID=911321 RepID=UPI00374252CE
MAIKSAPLLPQYHELPKRPRRKSLLNPQSLVRTRRFRLLFLSICIFFLTLVILIKFGAPGDSINFSIHSLSLPKHHLRPQAAEKLSEQAAAIAAEEAEEEVYIWHAGESSADLPEEMKTDDNEGHSREEKTNDDELSDATDETALEDRMAENGDEESSQDDHVEEEGENLEEHMESHADEHMREHLLEDPLGGMLEEPSEEDLLNLGEDGAEKLEEEMQNHGQEDALMKEIKEIISTHPVVVFSKTYCPYSLRAKGILRGYSLTTPFYVVEADERDDTYEIKQALTALTGRSTFPNVFINGQSVGGSDELQALHSKEELRTLLLKANVLKE